MNPYRDRCLGWRGCHEEWDTNAPLRTGDVVAISLMGAIFGGIVVFVCLAWPVAPDKHVEVVREQAIQTPSGSTLTIRPQAGPFVPPDGTVLICEVETCRQVYSNPQAQR